MVDHPDRHREHHLLLLPFLRTARLQPTQITAGRLASLRPDRPGDRPVRRRPGELHTAASVRHSADSKLDLHPDTAPDQHRHHLPLFDRRFSNLLVHLPRLGEGREGYGSEGLLEKVYLSSSEVIQEKSREELNRTMNRTN